MEEEQGWRLMDVSMGAMFDGLYDNAVLVPDSWREGCAQNILFREESYKTEKIKLSKIKMKYFGEFYGFT